MNKKYHIIYSVMLAIFIFMIVWVSVGDHSRSLVTELSTDHIAFSDDWLTEAGDEADTSHLNRLSDATPYKPVSIFHQLPDSLTEGVSLCFRSKNIFYQVYVDDELRYDPPMPESYVYNNSFGTRWNYVPLYSEDAGKTVELRFYTVYDSATACIDHLYIGSAAGEILTTFSDKMVSFVTCLLMLFVGILLIVADIPINMQSQKNHELLYLGMFAVSVALWCLSETNLLQFFTNDSRLMQIISCCSLIMIPIPIVLYLDAAFGFKKRIIVPIICYLSGAEFAICTILHFTKIMDYHETLTFSHIMLAISAVILLVTIVRNSFHTGQSTIKNIYKVLRAIGLMVIGFAAVIDIIRYYLGHSSDSAMFVRIGLLIFILCYGSSSLEKTINAVKLGVQTEFVSQLAYKDGLTGIGNRTAFQEHLVELEQEKDSIPEIGIIMFDVNDLKYVNDNLGHQKGDDMLVCSAKMITSALEPEKASCYRIGGDEFAAVMSGEDVTSRCENGILQFTLAMKEYNGIKGQPFRISIANGFAVYDKSQEGKRLMDIYQLADTRMYENKKQIKAKQITPQEYYGGQA